MAAGEETTRDAAGGPAMRAAPGESAVSCRRHEFVEWSVADDGTSRSVAGDQ